MQDTPETLLEEFFQVPPIDISVDVDSGGDYVAQTMLTLGSADLGCDIQAKIWEHELKYDDPDYPHLRNLDAEFEEGSVEMFVELFRRIRNSIASMMMLTELRVGYSGMEGLPDEDVENFHKAFDSLPDDFFVIDLEKAMDARQAFIDKDRQSVAGWKAILNLMNEEAMRRGYTKEQREKMTLGDVFELDEKEEK